MVAEAKGQMGVDTELRGFWADFGILGVMNAFPSLGCMWIAAYLFANLFPDYVYL